MQDIRNRIVNLVAGNFTQHKKGLAFFVLGVMLVTFGVMVLYKPLSNNFGQYAYQSKDSNLVTDFANRDDRTHLFTVTDPESKAGLSISFVQNPDNTDGVGAELVAPKVTDFDAESKKVVFEDVLPYTDLVYHVTENGVKEDIVLKSQEALTVVGSGVIEYAFNLSPANLEIQKTEEGIILPHFKIKDSSERFEFPPLYMEDASGITSHEVSLTISEVDNSDVLRLVVTPNLDWLSDPARVFPIRIDPSVVKGNGPILELGMDEDIGTTAYDTSGNNNDFDISEATRLRTSSRLNDSKIKYYQFDGTNDYLSRSSDTDFDFGVGSFTVSGWFRHPSTISGNQTLMSRYGGAGWQVYADSSGYICFGIDDDITWSPDDIACSTTSFTDNRWHRFEAVKSGTSSITLYMDGNQVAQDASLAATGSLSSSATLFVGQGIIGGVASTATTTITTSTDEGLGNQDSSWGRRVVYDPNNNRWHIVYIDAGSDLHTQSTSASSGTSWTDGVDINTGTWDYEHISCAVETDGATTYMHCAYSDEGAAQLYYKRCTLTGSAPYISCGSIQTVYDTGDANDDITLPRVAVDSNDCVLMVADVEDDSIADANDEHQIYFWKETGTCGDGTMASITPISTDVQTSAGFAVDSPVGIESYGDLDAQLYYIDTDSATAAQLLTIHFDGDTDTLGTERVLDADVEYDTTNVKYWSVIAGNRNITFAMDDDTTDIDAYIITSKDGALASQIDTNLDTTGTTADLSQTITAIVDTNTSGGDDIWLFAGDDTASNFNDIYYNVSTDGGDTWGGSPTLWIDGFDTTEVKFLSAAFSSETSDIMLHWLGKSATPWNINTKIVNTASGGGSVEAGYYWSGFLDSFTVFNYARSAEQVKADTFGSMQTSANFGNANKDILTDGLIGWWKLDETSGNPVDASGNGLTLTNNGTTTFNGARYYNGSEHVPASSQYLSTATAIPGIKTVSIWVNPDSDTNYMVNLTGSAYITSSSGTISVTGFTNPTIYVNGVQSTTLTADVWQHVLVTTDTAINADTFYLGRQDTNYYDGTLDEARLYNRVLTTNEITALYNWGPGPKLYYNFDEGTGTTIYERSGDSIINATMGANAQWQLGKIGTALYANDNTDDNAGAGTSVSTTTAIADGQDFTLMAWLYFEDAGSSNSSGNIISRRNCCGASEYSLMVSSDATSNKPLLNLIDQSADGNSTYSVLGSTTIPTRTWVHVAAVFDDDDANNTRVYLNGVDDTATRTGTLSAIGGFQDSLSLNFARTYQRLEGKIDEAKIYNYARTQAQILEDMNGGGSISYSSTKPTGLVGYWQFDENTGTVAQDVSDEDNNNDLTLSAASWTTSGKVGSAWNGTGSVYAYRADDADFDITATNDLSISGWFKSDAAGNPAAREALVGKVSENNPGYAVYFNTSGQLCFGIDDDTTWGPDVASCTSEDVYDATWHHFLAIRDNSVTDKTAIYIDGTLSDSDTDSTTATLGNYLDLKIGSAEIDTILIDNGDTGTSASGTWNEYGADFEYNSSSLYATSNGGVEYYRFTPTVNTASNYTVYIWTACSTQLESTVPHFIQYNGGSTSINVNQLRDEGGTCKEWYNLGTYAFDVGTGGYVEIRESGASGNGSYIGADAIKFVRADNYFNGDIDELKVFRSALNPDQIKTEFNLGKSGVMGATSTASNGTTADNTKAREHCVPGDTTTCNAPVVWWPMDENSSSLGVQDKSGNGNHAAEANLVWTKYDNSVPSDSDTSSTNGRVPLGSSGKGDDAGTPYPSVIKDGSTYKMWYTGYDGSNYRIYYATSPDGLAWTKNDNTVAGAPNCDSGSACSNSNGNLGLGTNGTGDDSWIYYPSVIKDGSTYKMWYAGYDGSNVRVYYATSTDGLTWTKYDNSIPSNSDTSSTNGRVPLGSSGKGDDGNVGKSWVIKDGDIYKMWYAGTDGTNRRVYYATSLDGLIWTKYNNNIPSASDVMGNNGRIPLGSTNTGDSSHVYSANVIKDGNIYRIWYEGYLDYYRTYYATSFDGLEWSKYDNSIPAPSDTTGNNGKIPVGTNGTGDDGGIYGFSVLKDDLVFKIWYTAFDGSSSRIYYATYATDGYSPIPTVGKIGGAQLFDGSDDSAYVATANDSFVDFNGSEAFTGSAWVYINTMPGSGEQDAVVTKWDQTSSLRGYRLIVENDDADNTGNFQVDLYDESADQTITASGADDTVAVNTWYYVTFSFNGGIAGAANDLKLYTNGTLTAGNSANASFLGLEDVAVDFSIGDYDGTDVVATDTPLAGKIDDLRVYDYARTPAQIAWDYNHGLPIAHYQFDECTGSTVYNAAWSPNGAAGNNGTITIGGGGSEGTLGDCDTSSTAWYNGANGKRNASLDFDGTDDYVGIGDQNMVKSISGATWTAWVKPGTISGHDAIVTQHTGVGSQVFWVGLTSGYLGTCRMVDEACDPASYKSSRTVATDQWSHVAVVFSGGNYLFYINGIYDSTIAAGASTILNLNAPINIGTQNNGAANFFDGQIDEVKIWNYALTAKQVQTDYNAGAVNFGP